MDCIILVVMVFELEILKPKYRQCAHHQLRGRASGVVVLLSVMPVLRSHASMGIGACRIAYLHARPFNVFVY